VATTPDFLKRRFWTFRVAEPAYSCRRATIWSTCHRTQALHILLGFLLAETDSRFAAPMSLDWTHGELNEGLRCFHSGAFFEAHEHWESVWLAAQEPERTFLQGLIQVAASFHHFQRGNCAGTISLLRSALRRLDGYPGTFAGIAVTPLRAAVRLWLEALETVPQSSPPPLPQLQLAERGSLP
jgi:predicted metal-dependent hydrolase